MVEGFFSCRIFLLNIVVCGFLVCKIGYSWVGELVVIFLGFFIYLVVGFGGI